MGLTAHTCAAHTLSAIGRLSQTGMGSQKGTAMDTVQMIVMVVLFVGVMVGIAAASHAFADNMKWRIGGK